MIISTPLAQDLRKGDSISTYAGLQNVEGVTLEGDRVHVRCSTFTVYGTRAFRTVSFLKSSKVRAYTS